MAVTSSWLTDVLVLILSLILFLYLYMKKKYKYWKERGIFTVEPVMFAGNALDLIKLKKHMGVWLKDLYDTTPDEPFVGIFVFNEPYLLLKSPDIIKHILVKDFNHFTRRSVVQPNHSEFYSNFLFFQKSESWKNRRSKLSPTFTAGKLKAIFPFVTIVGEKFDNHLRKLGGRVDAKEAAYKFSTDVIIKVFFGIDANCLTSDDAVFNEVTKGMFAFSLRNVIVQTSYMFKHELVHLFRLNFFDKHLTDFFQGAFWDSVSTREDMGQNSYCLVDILKEIRKQDPTFDGLTMAGSATEMFAGAVETTASTIAFTLYELCLNNDLQDKVRKEIESVLQNHSGLTYDGILEMKYLDMCVMETLRMYPVLAMLDRRCNKDYKIPGTDIVIEKGTAVFIPLLGLHYDEKHFPNPKKYIPERFLHNVNAEKLIYMPFGYGPRTCIGERLGMMNTKLAIIYVIKNFIIERNSDTPVPINFASKGFILMSTVGLPMNFKPLI